jgi:DNA-binding XRE family transcriptional regulator
MRKNHISHYRQKAGLTQNDLATRAQVAYSTLRRYESGVGEPSVYVAHDIAHALAVSIEEVFFLPDSSHCLLTTPLPASDEAQAKALLVRSE